MPEGIRQRVGKKGVGYEASVYLPGGGRQYKTFPTEKAAKKWRTSTMNEVYKGRRVTGTGITVQMAGEALIEQMEQGIALTRSGDRYKPSVIRSYASSLQAHVYKPLGPLPIEAVTRTQVQKMVDGMLRSGANASTVRNALMPLRVIYRRAMQRSLIDASPCEHLEVPAVRGVRDRIADANEAARLLVATPLADRAIWATAFYAGLRRGEIRGLRVQDIDLEAGVIRVEQAMDELAGVIATKTRAGTRSVPLLAVLRPYLADLPVDGLAFQSERGGPFNIGRVRLRAEAAWRRTYECGCVSKAKEPPLVCEEHEAPHLEAIGLHECRHTFASVCIAAGVNAKALSTFIGHSSIQVTFDRYGHLMPGSETEAAEQIDAYITRTTVAKTVAREAAKRG